MAISKIDSDGITAGGITADSLDIGQIGGRRNLIINGGQRIDQRNASVTAGGTYVTDRFKISDRNNFDQRGFTAAQSSVSPDGFSNSLKIDCTTAETVIDADENARVQYIVEAQDAQSLGYGTSSAQSVTLSFYVKSNVTGTYAVSIYQNDGVRIIGSTYTIDSADTWERKTITFAGDTSGTINNDNGAGLQIQWGLTVGSNYTGTDNTSWGAYADAKFLHGQTANLFSSNTNEWLITGVQLEVGDTATPFEHRSYGEELALCQRYYYRLSATANDQPFCMAVNNGSTVADGVFHFPVSLRAAPTALEQSGTASDYGVSGASGSGNLSSVPSFLSATTDTARVRFTKGSGLTQGHSNTLVSGSSTGANAYLGWSSEL